MKLSLLTQQWRTAVPRGSNGLNQFTLARSEQEGEDPLLDQPAPKLGASVKTEGMMLVVMAFARMSILSWIVHSCFWLFRESSTRDGRPSKRLTKLQMDSGIAGRHNWPLIFFGALGIAGDRCKKPKSETSVQRNSRRNSESGDFPYRDAAEMEQHPST